MHQFTPTTVAQDVAVVGFNLGVWFATALSWAHINELMTTVATTAAVAVSIASFLWIRKQSRAFDTREKLQEEGLRLENQARARKLGVTEVDGPTE